MLYFIFSWVSIKCSLVAQMVKNLPAIQETWVQSLSLEDPWMRTWQPTPVFSPGESHGQRSLVGYSPWGRKESDTTEWLHFFFFFSYIAGRFFTNWATREALFHLVGPGAARLWDTRLPPSGAGGKSYNFLLAIRQSWRTADIEMKLSTHKWKWSHSVVSNSLWPHGL